MVGRTLRAAVAALSPVGLLIAVTTTPGLAIAPVTAASCALAVPSTSAVGIPFSVIGSGFPATTIVDVSIVLDGSTPDEFSVQSDTAGGFRIDMTPEPEDVGATTVVASVAGGCSASATLTVVGPAASATPGPSATPTPTSKPSSTPKPTPKPMPRPTAQPTPAGAVAAVSATPPRSDVLRPGGSAQDGPSGVLADLALVMIVAGSAGLLVAGFRRRPVLR